MFPSVFIIVLASLDSLLSVNLMYILQAARSCMYAYSLLYKACYSSLSLIFGQVCIPSVAIGAEFIIANFSNY